MVVTGHGAEEVEGAVRGQPGASVALDYARQEPQLGTGHACSRRCRSCPTRDGTRPTLAGDVPLIAEDTLRAGGGEWRRAATNCSPSLDDPTGYGRVVRGGSGAHVPRPSSSTRTPPKTQRAIREIYSGVMAAPAAALKRWLGRLGRHDNTAQGEYYLTDVARMAVDEGTPVVAEVIDDEMQVA